MKQRIGTIRFALTYAGCFLGAGYVSGQELWQYFGTYGRVALPAVVLSIVLIGLVTLMVMTIVLRKGGAGVDIIVIRWNIPWLRQAVFAMVEFMFFGITSVMLAGIGALGKEMFGFPIWVAALMAIICCAILAFFGFDGVVSVFSMSVPILVITAFIIVCVRLKNVGISQITFPGGSTNPMLGPWWFSVLNYMALNVTGSIGIVAPVSMNIKGKGCVLRGIIIGTLLLIMLGCGILSAVASAPESIAYELPMLSIAEQTGKGFRLVYAILLFLAMFGNALSTMVAVLEYIRSKIEFFGKHKLTAIIILSVLQFVLSLAGFSGLIGIIYPIYGYLSLVMAILITEQYFHGNMLKRKKEGR